MPEEVNLMVTDSISDFFFVTEESGKSSENRKTDRLPARGRRRRAG
ncbi:MAG: hypothetical protein L6263_06255 [Desulfobacteraceae bacterium]|nr:hypothetical protein [Desulfobacteraceae bacterium]